MRVIITKEKNQVKEPILLSHNHLSSLSSRPKLILMNNIKT